MFSAEDVETLLDLRAFTVAVEQAPFSTPELADRVTAMARRRRMRELVERLLNALTEAKPIKEHG